MNENSYFIYILVLFQVLFDHNGVLRKFEHVQDILKEFFDLRLKYYIKRKAYMVEMFEAEALKLSNQVLKLFAEAKHVVLFQPHVRSVIGPFPVGGIDAAISGIFTRAGPAAG